MGYMGFGMQRWITTYKPKPWFGRRKRPGSEFSAEFSDREFTETFHLEKNSLENLRKKKPTKKYLNTLRSRMKKEDRKKMILASIIIFLIVLLFVVAIIYIENKFDLF